MPNLAKFVFKLAKSAISANFAVSTPVACFKSDFVAELDKSYSTFIMVLLRVFDSGKQLTLFSDIFFISRTIQ